MLKRAGQIGALALVGFLAVSALRAPQHPLIERAFSYGVLPAFLMKLNDEQVRMTALAEIGVRPTLPLVITAEHRAYLSKSHGDVCCPGVPERRKTDIARGEALPD